jgi:hypothetical protein
MRYTKHLIGLLIIATVITFSCNEKTASAARKNNIKIKSAFTQKEIPGQQDATPKNFLNVLIEFTGQDEIILDSILFDGKIYKIGAAIPKIKIDLARGTIAKDQYAMQANEALLFYSFNNKNDKMTIKNIETKEPIYLP